MQIQTHKLIQKYKVKDDTLQIQHKSKMTTIREPDIACFHIINYVTHCTDPISCPGKRKLHFDF